jgi:hypothetical protein
MKVMMALGAVMWVLIAIWAVRFGMGLEHLDKSQIPALIVGGLVGWPAARWFVGRHVRKLATARNR